MSRNSAHAVDRFKIPSKVLIELGEELKSGESSSVCACRTQNSRFGENRGEIVYNGLMPSHHRRSARVILLDETGSVLLIRFSVTRDSRPFVFWATPGGGIEGTEAELEAAKRELIEELHLDIPLTGPVHAASSDFEHEGTLTTNTDVFFVGQCGRDVPRLDALTDGEREAMQCIKWWSAEEIEHTTDLIFPPDLGLLIRNLVSTV